MEVIERDLVKWRRGKWAAVIVTVFALQVGLFIWASQKEIRTRTVYPAEPRIAYAPAASVLDREWLELENPFLFAAASTKGFSGEAWLRQPEWRVPETGREIEPPFLDLAEAREFKPRENVERSFSLLPGRRAELQGQLPTPEERPGVEARKSELKLADFKGRTLAVPLPLPLQYHSDVLSSTVVEAMVGRDGFVISARVIENSGSARADGDALALARRARFTPVNSGENVPQVGKLIFEWFALNLSQSNSVNRANGASR